METVLIPVDSIKLERFDFPETEFEGLRDSIREHGLLHPITVELEKEGKFGIIAGKKRLFVFKKLNLDVIPCLVLPKLEEVKSLKIRIHENLIRDNLQWYDIVVLEKAYHDLLVQKSGGKVENKFHPKKPWSQNDTARELGIALSSFNEDMNLATALAKNPHLKKVKDKVTALKLIRTTAKREQSELDALLPSSDSFEMNQVLLGDSLEILKEFPKEVFDASIVDPPWSTYSRNEDLTATQIDLLPIFAEIFRVSKRDSFLYVITSSVDQPHYMNELPKIGFQVQQYPLIWYKDRNITHGRKNWQYARDYEPIILAVKGNPALTSGTEISSILSYSNLHYTKMIHENEKPIDLLKQIIKNCTYEGSKILDCFAGSGVTLQAAKELGRQYIGIEREKKYYDRIVERLRA